MDLFMKFVEENVDRTQDSKVERMILLKKELDKEFAHYCRKRNLSFNEGIIQLMEQALQHEKQHSNQTAQEKEPSPARFMDDAL
ncbi:hypothetical protein ADL26_19085 [Thermoactinomyces vulgaris]|nr:hypothetical protein ADL26_19085 [Thermoactinomyces vulgaris]